MPYGDARGIREDRDLCTVQALYDAVRRAHAKRRGFEFV
jgi:hypothetical protein